MIKCTELRIGNMVKYLGTPYPSYPLKDAIVKVEEILSDGVNRSQGDSTLYEADKLEGIPLTTEWLEKFGFGKSKSDDDEQRDIWGIQVANNTSLYYDPEEENKHWYLSYEWNNNHFQNDFWACPEHVHQLQNLFFALAGEEIPLNEKA